CSSWVSGWCSRRPSRRVRGKVAPRITTDTHLREKGGFPRGNADPPRTARGREHPNLSGGGRGERATGDAVFGREGQLGDAAPGDEGVRPVEAAVAGVAGGYDLEVPGDVRVPRQDGSAARR